RLRGEADRDRSRRDLVGLRRRRRRRRLERRRRDVQRDARTGPPRLHRTADREAVERQPPPRDGRGPGDRQEVATSNVVAAEEVGGWGLEVGADALSRLVSPNVRVPRSSL